MWEAVVALLIGGVLFAGCVLVILPFAPALLWAAIISLTTWNLFQKLSKKLGDRKAVAASLIVGTFIVLLILPLIYFLIEFSTQIDVLHLKFNTLMAQGLPPLPNWLSELPLVGHRLDAWWSALANGDPEIKQRVRELLMGVLGVLVHAGKIAGQGFGVLLLSAIFVLFFYIGGARGLFLLEGALIRIGGTRATELLNIAARTIKSVVMGILGTAAVQGILAALGFALAGVPMSIALGVGTAVLSLVPMGPALLWIPAAFWLHHGGQDSWAIFIVLWGALVVGTADNFIKPLLIGKGTDLPLLLIMVGVLGGAMNFGLLGVFLGPTLLAVGFALLRDWVENRPR